MAQVLNGEVFPCPCGGFFSEVIESRGRSTGWIWRRRTCPDCGTRFSTREVPMDDDSEPEPLPAPLRAATALREAADAFEEAFEAERAGTSA